VPRERVGGVWPGNETLGLPQGLNVRPLSILDALILTPGCEFGVCTPIGEGFANATAAIPELVEIGGMLAAGALAGALVLISMEQSDVNPKDVIEYRCSEAFEKCLDNPWQPWWNEGRFGKKKDCASCYRECKHSEGEWPSYKCPE